MQPVLVEKKIQKGFLKNRFFQNSFMDFQKCKNRVILFCNFLRQKCVDQKNGVHHDEEHGKMKKIAVSDFSFSKLCHRDFRKTFSEIFAILEFFNFFKKVKISENV